MEPYHNRPATVCNVSGCSTVGHSFQRLVEPWFYCPQSHPPIQGHAATIKMKPHVVFGREYHHLSVWSRTTTAQKLCAIQGTAGHYNQQVVELCFYSPSRHLSKHGHATTQGCMPHQKLNSITFSVCYRHQFNALYTQ